MSLTAYNGGLLLAWLLMTAGGVLVHLGGGLFIGGALLAAWTLCNSLRFGVYATPKQHTQPGDAGRVGV